MATERDIRDAARDRSRREMHYLARYERQETESYLRHEGRGELTPSEREFAEEIAREEGLWL